MRRSFREIHRLLQDPVVQRLVVAAAIAIATHGIVEPKILFDAVNYETVLGETNTLAK